MFSARCKRFAYTACVWLSLVLFIVCLRSDTGHDTIEFTDIGIILSPFLFMFSLVAAIHYAGEHSSNQVHAVRPVLHTQPSIV